MKTLLFFIFTFSTSCFTIAQKKESELLKNYDFYVEKNIEMGKWKTKYHLSDGLVSIQEKYWKNELRSRTEYKYDEFENLKRETETYNINDGKVNNVSRIKLKYNGNLLISRVFDYGMTEKYADFNIHGKPQVIERIDENNIWPYKETFEYDENGNIIKSIVFSSYFYGDTANEKATTYFKYDGRNNVVEIRREFEPKQEFPILMVGGPHKYELESFRYIYNDLGLWTKKFKTINGKEYLVAKRKYK